MNEPMAIEALKEAVIIGRHLGHTAGGWLYYDMAVATLKTAGVNVDDLASCVCHSPEPCSEHTRN